MFLCPISSLQRHLYIVSSENLHGTNSWTQFFHLCFQAFLYSQYLIPRQSFSPPWGYNKWFGWFYPAAFFSILPGRTAGFYTHNHQTDIYIKVMSLQSSLDGAFGCNLPNMMELADKWHNVRVLSGYSGFGNAAYPWTERWGVWLCVTLARNNLHCIFSFIWHKLSANALSSPYQQQSVGEVAQVVFSMKIS